MKVFQTDARGYYVGPVEADESPLERGVFHIPYGAVSAAPPTVQQGQRARWVDEAWVVEDDPPPPPPEPVTPPVVRPITFKADIFRRMTDAEVETFETIMAQKPKRKRKIFEHAQFIDHADVDFAELKAGFVTAFGQQRADELLAPSA